jgi:hypothetical protein
MTTKSKQSNQLRAGLERETLAFIKRDPSYIHRMPSCAWDAASCVVDAEWRFLACIGQLSASDARCFALWYAGVYEGCKALHDGTR